MAVISGGTVLGPSTANPGIGNRIYNANGAPTDANLGVTPALPNGAIAQDVLTGNIYERQAGVWVRIDTL